MDDQIAAFTAFTGSDPEKAQRYLTLTDGNVEQAVDLFFSNPDLGAAVPSQPTQPSNRDDPINIDDEDDEVEMTGSAPAGGHSYDDDEAMARRLQEEMYGSGGGGAAGGGRDDLDAEGVRAPMARTTETLVGPGGFDDPNDMNAAIFEQLAQRRMGGARRGQAGIFNQREASIWAGDDQPDPDARREALSRATGGASDQSSKSNLLAELFKPPFDLMSRLPWGEARDEGKEELKWLLVNVQDPSIFDCQVLNRDIWKNKEIRDTIQEHFIFLQYNKDDPRGREYIQYYFANMRDSEDAYPHIAIVDPRTGEQVKTWSGSPSPKASDFLMDLHEFLDRYSLSLERKNPVQTKRKESKKDVGQMTEEEMLEMAMQNSLANGGTSKDEDPDSLTRSDAANTNDKGKERMSVSEAMDIADLGPVTSHAENGTAQPQTGSLARKETTDTPFSRISSTSPHEEPTSTGPETTRIQFRYSGGRVVRRFALTEPVSRIYEWLKAAPFDGKDAKEFELIAMGKNLIGSLEIMIQEAGLKNATVMVEFPQGEDEEEEE
ncbi:UBX domain protein Ubx2 [Recurvomyces mirabilis]|nr:UBX domain protein Ubx2 [Recurvomyces mirabilis]